MQFLGKELGGAALAAWVSAASKTAPCAAFVKAFLFL